MHILHRFRRVLTRRAYSISCIGSSRPCLHMNISSISIQSTYHLPHSAAKIRHASVHLCCVSSFPYLVEHAVSVSTAQPCYSPHGRHHLEAPSVYPLVDICCLELQPYRLPRYPPRIHKVLGPAGFGCSAPPGPRCPHCSSSLVSPSLEA
ncbi:hypothetical protein CYLTODRAFT_493124 [Cylindrobasidium torrendii FP15055 ss-10]|uniref:Uncharacterized protein n=1 Tax=Cylindrobasidium torrendii FP15055 ss-10 TaxID=1314674 RepID=A0A0D7B1V1_9AGAR|nr:hypothetical protein CYLTODRAFT_493124 [Cylindrobasidium torrendii FP15055 ss-10]